LIFVINLVNSAAIVNHFVGLGRGAAIGGEVTEIVSAPTPTNSASAASVADANIIVDLESVPYTSIDPLITGEDSILQNQNPLTAPAPEPTPAPARPALPYYAAGPYLDGYFIFPTSGFNRGILHAYNAVDISNDSECLSDNIPVYAAASGVVSAVYTAESTSRYANGGYGNNIMILHPNGVLTRYAHLKMILVSAGQYVNQGSIIAYMGGYPGMVGAGNSTGCHVHFEVRGAKNPFVNYSAYY